MLRLLTNLSSLVYGAENMCHAARLLSGHMQVI